MYCEVRWVTPAGQNVKVAKADPPASCTQVGPESAQSGGGQGMYGAQGTYADAQRDARFASSSAPRKWVRSIATADMQSQEGPCAARPRFVRIGRVMRSAHPSALAPGLAVTLTLVLAAGGCDDEEKETAKPEADPAEELSKAGFKQPDEDSGEKPDEESAEDVDEGELPPERLWSPKELGFGKKSKKGECFPMTEKDYQQVVGRAGDQVVLVQDFTAIFHAYTLDATKNEEDTLENRKKLVHELIDQELLALAARRKGYESKQVGELLKKRELASMIKKDMRDQAKSEQSEEAYQKFYKQNPKKYMIHPDQRKIVTILIKGKKAAAKLIARVKAEELSMKQFMKYARSMSLDPDAKKTSGKTGWFDREGMDKKDRVVPEVVAQAAFKLKKKGDLYKHPLPSSSGWHVIRLLTERDEKWIPFYKVRGSIAAKFVSQRQDELVEKLLDNMKKNHPVSVNKSTLEKISPAPCL